MNVGKTPMMMKKYLIVSSGNFPYLEVFVGAKQIKSSWRTERQLRNYYLPFCRKKLSSKSLNFFLIRFFSSLTSWSCSNSSGLLGLNINKIIHMYTIITGNLQQISKCTVVCMPSNRAAPASSSGNLMLLATKSFLNLVQQNNHGLKLKLLRRSRAHFTIHH